MIGFKSFFGQWHGHPLSEKLSDYLENKIKVMNQMNMDEITECEYEVFEQCIGDHEVDLSACTERTTSYRSIIKRLETGEITSENATSQLQSLGLLND